jgi:hypothetical protein
MWGLLRVLRAIVVAPCLMLMAAPVEAADGVVLIGCDLFSREPRVEFVQSHGVSTGSGKSNRRRFVSGSNFRSDDFEGRDCAEVLSEAIDDGLVFQAMNVFGQDSELALWFFQED